MPYLLALDQGTTSSRAMVFDEYLQVVAVEQREFRQHFPKPGWVEHDPEEIWESQRTVAQAALARVEGDEVVGVGITNQRETVVVWDRRTGEAIYPAIVWQDRRTADFCQSLNDAGHADMARQRTGLLFDPYFSGTKVSWLLDHVAGARAAAEAGHLALGTVDAWLIWKLTGGARHVTDASNASRTLLYNIHTGTWDAELLDLLRIPSSMLPDVVDSCGVCARTDAPGIGGLPIAGIAGDQQAALFGQACFTPGMTKTTYGTGCFMLMYTGSKPVPSRHQLLTTVAWQHRGVREYALEGSVFSGGAVIQWLRDGLGIIENAAASEALARSVQDSGGLVLVPAFAGLGAPHWDPHARGVLVGLTRGTTSAHIARAALESIAYQVAELARAMEKDSDCRLPEMRVDGGAADNALLLQLQADVLDAPVARSTILESTAAGAAALAGLAVGVWPDREALTRIWRVGARFEPAMAGDERQRRERIWREAVHRARDWARIVG